MGTVSVPAEAGMEGHILEQQILRRDRVLEITGLKNTTLWRRIRSGDFPEPIRLGGAGTRAVGWRRADVEKWLEKLEKATA